MSAPAILIFSRMDSTRLPGKALADLGGRPMLGRVLDRVRRASRGAAVIVATSDRVIDDPIAAFCSGEGAKLFRGSCDDVAGRALACCDANGFEHFVRISGDSPFMPPELIDRVIDTAKTSDVDIVTNVFPRSFPAGASVEVISAGALRKAHPDMTASDRENVTTYFYAAADAWKISSFSAPDERYAGVRLTVDTPEELERARAIIALLGPEPERVSLGEVAGLCRSLVEAA